MKQGFEEKFMDLQSELISLCLELVEQKAEKVYAYGSIEKNSKAFNVFYEIEGEFVHKHELNKYQAKYIYSATPQMRIQLMKLGIEDLEKIEHLCREYDTPIPTEFKMVYDVTTGKYNADYKYTEVCTAKTGVDSSVIFMNWYNEIVEQSHL